MMKDAYYCLIRFSVIVMFSVSLISAKPGGYVVKQGAKWALSKVSVIDLTSGKEVVIDDGKCYGPVFSPDGKKVAYARSGDNDIFIKNSDGTGVAKAQGLSVKTEGGGKTEPCMSWVIINGVEYLYWSERTTEVYRTKLDSKVKEVAWKNSILLICVSVSADGKRGACTIPGYSAFQFDMETNKTKGYKGCQGSICPSGKYITHNTTTAHKNTSIHDFDAQTTVKIVNTPTGQINWQRFSHHTDDYFCATVNDKIAYICEWQTGTYTEVGPGSPLDYYPKEIPGYGNLDKEVSISRTLEPATQERVLQSLAENMITINSSNPYSISITNLSGKVLYQYRNNTPHTLQLQQTGLNEGFYVIRAEIDGKTIARTLPYLKAK